jgi:hypothetical protein
VAREGTTSVRGATGSGLMALDAAPEAAASLVAAREIFARLGAKPTFAETDALLAPAGNVAS